jgi:hypothetical protein
VTDAYVKFCGNGLRCVELPPGRSVALHVQDWAWKSDAVRVRLWISDYDSTSKWSVEGSDRELFSEWIPVR